MHGAVSRALLGELHVSQMALISSLLQWLIVWIIRLRHIFGSDDAEQFTRSCRVYVDQPKAGYEQHQAKDDGYHREDDVRSSAFHQCPRAAIVTMAAPTDVPETARTVQFLARWI